MGLLLGGNKQNHKNAQDHSANKFNKYQVIASIPEEHNLNLVAFGRILIIYVHVSQPVIHVSQFFVDNYLFQPLSMTHTLYFCEAPVSGSIMWCNTFFFTCIRSQAKAKILM